jgi:hypothetical protein
LPVGAEEIAKILRIFGDLAEIRSERLSNTTVEHYHYHNQLRLFNNTLATICVMQTVISHVERAEVCEQRLDPEIEGVTGERTERHG